MCSFCKVYFIFLLQSLKRGYQFLYQLLPCQKIQSIYLQCSKYQSACRKSSNLLGQNTMGFGIYICVCAGNLLQQIDYAQKAFLSACALSQKEMIRFVSITSTPARTTNANKPLFPRLLLCTIPARIVERALALSLLQHLYDLTNLQLKSAAARKSSLSSSFVHRTWKRTRKIYAHTLFGFPRNGCECHVAQSSKPASWYGLFIFSF